MGTPSRRIALHRSSDWLICAAKKVVSCEHIARGCQWDQPSRHVKEGACSRWANYCSARSAFRIEVERLMQNDEHLNSGLRTESKRFEERFRGRGSNF